MFQLEQELDAWKNRLGQSEAMRSVDLVELEQHVRDSIANLIPKGLTDEEAFLVAVHRIGDPDQIASEFEQVNGRHVWGQRIFWMIAGFLLLELYQLTINALAWLSGLLTATAGGNGSAIGYAASLVTAFWWFALVMGLQRLLSFRNSRSSWRPTLSRISIKVRVLCLTVLAVISVLLNWTGRILLTRTVSQSELGEAAIIFAYSNTFLAVIVPLTLLFVMWKLRRELQNTAYIEY